jgi:ADP-ribose pyrophosphatase YjhB (NUDIX family)
MNDPRFQFEKIIVTKALVENSEGKLLLVKEPQTNAWMPGKWGLPGGKPFKEESIKDTFQRKMKEELGLELEPEGLFRIEELVLRQRTVVMFILVAKMLKGEIKGMASEHKWVDINEVRKMSVNLFTEYYIKDLVGQYLGGERKVIPLALVKTWDFQKLEKNDDEFQIWWEEAKKYVK